MSALLILLILFVRVTLCLPDVTICFLTRHLVDQSAENVAAFYESGNDFFNSQTNKTFFEVSLQNYDLDAYDDASAAAIAGYESGCEVFIFKGSSSDAVGIATFLDGIPLLTVGSSSTSTELSNYFRFPLFMRVVPEDTSQGGCLASFANMYALNDAFIIYSSGSYSEALYDTLSEQLTGRSIVVRGRALVDGTTASYENAFSDIRATDVSVVLVVSSSSATIGLFQLAAAHNLTGAGYVWLTADAVTTYLYELEPGDPDWLEVDYVVGMAPAQAMQEYVAYTYDATQAVLRAIDNVIDSMGSNGYSGMGRHEDEDGVDGDNGSITLNALSIATALGTLDFEGRTGNIYFNEMGNRQMGNYTALSFYQHSSTLVGYCMDDLYVISANVSLSDDVVLEPLGYVPLQTQYWKLLPRQGASPSRRTRASNVICVEASGFYSFGGILPGQRIPFGDLHFFSIELMSWSEVETTNSPPARFGAAFACAGDSLFLYGGVGDENEILGDMHEMKRSTGVWSEIDAFREEKPLPRRDFATSPSRNGFYIFGGYSPYESQEFFSDLWEFSITNQTWILHLPSNSSQAVVPPLVLASMTCSPTWDRVYIFGGSTNYATDHPATYAFDVFSATWALLSPNNSVSIGRNQAVLGYASGYLVAGLGHSYALGHILADFYRLDVTRCVNGTCAGWERLQMRDFARSSMGTCPVYAGWAYCVGGQVSGDITNDLNRFRLYGDAEVLKLTETISRVGERSLSVAGANAVVQELDVLVVYGGWTESDPVVKVASDFDVSQRDFDARMTDAIHLRKFMGTATFGALFAVFGGQNKDGTILGDFIAVNIIRQIFLQRVHSAGESAWPTPRYKHVMVPIGDEEFWMFGGAQSGSEPLYDTWKCNIWTLEWTLLHNPTYEEPIGHFDISSILERYYPTSTRGGAAVLVGDHVFYLGGEIWSSMSSDAIHAFSLTTNSWVRQSVSLLSPRAYHVAASVGSRIVVYGGQHRYELFSDIFYLLVLSTSPDVVLSGPHSFSTTYSSIKPRPRAHHWGSLVGHSLITGGGVSSILSYQETHVAGDVYEYVLGPVCTRAQVQANETDDCWLCTAGSYHSTQVMFTNDTGLETMHEIYCPLCMKGTYSQHDGSLECSPCPPGYKSSPGSTTWMSCTPCGRGNTFDDLLECVTCDVPTECPAAWAGDLRDSPVDFAFYQRAVGGEVVEVQPKGLEGQREEIAKAILYIFNACLLLSVVLAIAMFAIGASEWGRALLARADSYAAVHLAHNDRLLRSTPTALGGFFSVQYLVLCGMVLALTIVPSLVKNQYEVRTKEPRSMVALHRNGHTSQSTYTTVLSYLSSVDCSCQESTCAGTIHSEHIDEGWLPCNDGVHLSTSGIKGDVDMTCRYVSKICQIRVHCDTCTFSLRLAEIGLLLDYPFATTDAFLFEFNATSGYPGQESAVAASVVTADLGVVFRGETPTVATIGVTETLFEDNVDDVEETGILISLLGIESGEELSTLTYTQQHSLSFSINMHINGNAVKISRYRITTVLTVFSYTFSVISAFSGLFVMAMRAVEYTARQIERFRVHPAFRAGPQLKGPKHNWHVRSYK
eukprot:Rmarinus@m.23452